MTAQPSQERPSKDEVLDVLAHGSLEVVGRLTDASNTTLVATATSGDLEITCVYKPTRGERPLWDFPDRTLGQREVATYLVAEAARWCVVPPTTWREDGPQGQGMVQSWVDAVDEESAVPGAGLVDVVPVRQVPNSWLHVLDAHGRDGEPVALIHADNIDLARMALLDAVTNNADRKGGHILYGRSACDPAPRVYGVDHGLCWHHEDKLRTVLWGWAGQSLPEELLAEARSLESRWADEVAVLLAPLLDRAEVSAARRRLRSVLRDAAFPVPGEGWPSLPWPAF